MNGVTPEAAARRDAYRQHGRFGLQPADESGEVVPQPTTALDDAPDCIDRDIYTGTHIRRHVPEGMRDSAFIAREIARSAAQGVMWEFSGHLRDGRPLYVRSRYVADLEGNLHLYDSDGRKVLTHPANRTIRVLVH